MFKSRYTRVRPARTAPVRVQLMAPGVLELLQARDVSRSGLSVNFPGEPPACKVDDEIELVVTLPGCRPFRAWGEVRHVTAYFEEGFLGVEFMEIADAHRQILEDYVDERLEAERGLRP